MRDQFVNVIAIITSVLVIGIPALILLYVLSDIIRVILN